MPDEERPALRHGLLHEDGDDSRSARHYLTACVPEVPMLVGTLDTMVLRLRLVAGGSFAELPLDAFRAVFHA